MIGIFEIATLGGTIAGILLGGPMFDAFLNHAFTLNSIFYLLSLAIFFFGMKTHARRPEQSALNEARNIAREMTRFGRIVRQAFAPMGLLARFSHPASLLFLSNAFFVSR